MEKIELSRGFTPKVAGMPDMTRIRVPFPSTIGISAGDIPFIRPKLLVKEGDAVRTGTPVFSDKRDRSVNYVSPATGKVQQIRFGKRRRLIEVIVSAETIDDFVEFPPVSAGELAGMEKADLTERLKQGGLWQSLRQFPALDNADPAHSPSMIIVSLNGNDLFSPHPAVVLDGNEEAFETGMAALERFAHRIVVTARESSMKRLGSLGNEITDRITHVTDDTYPAWNPGAVLYQIKQNQAENTAWCISLEHVIMVGKFLSTGRYPVEKVVTITQAGDRRPHLLTRQGAPVRKLAGHFIDDSMITTGQLNGRILEPDGHIGFFENTVNIIENTDGEEMFGFVWPGLNKPSVSSTFLSALFNRPQVMDCTLHGELRACINCSYCERICPNSLMPNFIMKALHADEIEEALACGMMDCCQCGLCSFTCPSKIELAKILSDGMESHYKDKA